jgi:hypothetical protein
LLGVHDLPPDGWGHGAGGSYPGTPPHDNRGFFFQLNWLPIYVLAIPIFFACAVRFAVWLREAVQRISRCPGGVITAPPECPFALFVQIEVARSGRRALRLATIAGILVIIIDRGQMIRAFYQNDFSAVRPYWAIAHLHAKHVDLMRNAVFDVIAYLFEGLFVFLFAFVTVKFFAFLQVLSSTIHRRYQERGYVFTPFWHDPARRLGLSAVGVPYTAFISLATAVTGFAFLHRLQLLSEMNGGWPQYVRDLEAFVAGDWSYAAGLARISTVTTGMVAMIVGLTIPAGVIAYFPLYQLRRRIQREINDENDMYPLKRQLAKTNEERAELAERHRVLKSTNVWPNGDDTAHLLMSIWVSLFGAAVYPPFAIIGGFWVILHCGLLLQRKLFPRAKAVD